MNSSYLAALQTTFKGAIRLQLAWDASMHHEETMVFIVWSHMTQLAGYPAIQAIQHSTMGDIDAHPDLVDQFVDGKLKHQSSLTYIKSIEGTLKSRKN